MSKSSLSIDYDIVRSKRKSVSIVINDGVVVVRAPYRTPKYWIAQFVAEKQAWIEKKVSQQLEKQQQHYQLMDGAKLPFMGATLELKLLAAARNKITLEQDQLTIEQKDLLPSTRVQLMDKWLLQQAKLHLVDIVTIFAKELGLDHLLTKVKFRKTKSKWGHCTHDGVLQLNQLILLAPEFVQKYLIIHELCHLVHLNHSKAYWALVEGHYPEYKVAQKWLKENGHKLWYQ